jgi:tetratricopeptide (TPR) repeat protein
MLGNALLDKNDLDGAIRQYKKVIDIDKKDAAGHGNLGNVLRTKKDLKGAIHHLKEAVALAPDDRTYQSNLGNALCDNGEFDAAIEHYEKAIAVKDDSAVAHIGLGTALSRKNDWVAAMRHFKKAIEIDPKSAEAHFKVGLAFEVAKDFDGAIQYYEKAIERNNKHADAHNNLAVVLRAAGRLKEAIPHLEKAIVIEPKRGLFYRNLAAFLAESKDIQGAMKRYQQAIELDDRDEDAYYNLGLTFFFEKDFETAIRKFEKTIAINPSHAQATCQLGHTYRELGDFEKAVKFLSGGHELGSKQPGWSYPSANWIKHSEQLLALDRRLSAVLRHETEPAGWQERLVFADLCRRYKRQYAAAATFYAEGLAANPAAANTPEWQLRFRAATCAAQASAGQGKDAGNLDDEARAKFRRQALLWLQADLDLYDKTLRTRASERDAFVLLLAAKQLGQWPSDAALAGLRDDQVLAGLGAKEQKMWRQLWSQAAELAKKSRACFNETTIQGTLTPTKREERHELKLPAGQILIIDMESPQFDTFLRLEDDQAKVLAENDDISPDNLNSRLVFTTPKAALYRIVATSYQQRGRGAYTLTIRKLIEKP